MTCYFVPWIDGWGICTPWCKHGSTLLFICSSQSNDITDQSKEIFRKLHWFVDGLIIHRSYILLNWMMKYPVLWLLSIYHIVENRTISSWQITQHGFCRLCHSVTNSLNHRLPKMYMIYPSMVSLSPRWMETYVRVVISMVYVSSLPDNKVSHIKQSLVSYILIFVLCCVRF